ncbi:MAG: DUF2513 domain-containing protein [Planctomycetaceae bacterium]
MKRDLELIRGLLAEIEAMPPDTLYETESSSLAALDVLAEHMRLLEEAGFVRKVTRDRSANSMCRGLTWQGHEFLAATRSDTVWKKTKEFFREKLLSMSGVPLHVLQEVCVSVARDELGLD